MRTIIETELGEEHFLGPELAKVITPTGIGTAVHSRIADCRKKFDMIIEQRGTWTGRRNESSYRYLPSEQKEAA